MMTALVTGCSGFLGSHLCKELKNDGWKVIGIDIKPTNKYIDRMWCDDVRNNTALDEIFNSDKIDVVFHLAGRIEVGLSVQKPAEFFSVNTGGTTTLLEAMEKHGVQHIIYSSSAAVYKPSDDMLNETNPIQVNSPYGHSKYCSEQIIENCKVNYVIFRYFNLVGADPEGDFGEDHDPETHLIPVILKNLNNFSVYGTDYETPDGTCIRDYVHVTDVAKAHLQAAYYLLNNNKSITLNLGNGKGYSVFEIISFIEKIVGKKVSYDVAPRRQGDPPSLVADISLAKNVLQFNPKYDILESIKTAYDWYKK